VCSSDLNLGVRHVLPAVAPLAVLVGARVGRVWDGTGRTALRVAVAAALVAHVAEGAFGARDGLAWWNAAAGGTRGGWRIATGSNADWGQGFARLRDEVRDLGLTDVWILPANGPQSSRDRLGDLGFRVFADASRKSALPDSGWLAVSTSCWRTGGHDPVTDAPPDHFLAGTFRVYRLPIRERTQ
jgi:hypothetical protein